MNPFPFQVWLFGWSPCAECHGERWIEFESRCLPRAASAKAERQRQRWKGAFPAAVQSEYIRAPQALVASCSPFRMLGTTLAINVLLQGPYVFLRSHPPLVGIQWLSLPALMQCLYVWHCSCQGKGKGKTKGKILKKKKLKKQSEDLLLGMRECDPLQLPGCEVHFFSSTGNLKDLPCIWGIWPYLAADLMALYCSKGGMPVDVLHVASKMMDNMRPTYHNSL